MSRDENRELNSWKEIADYLKITVRTAQNWEKERGLPVHRLPGRRGPVSVKVSELEQWKRNGRLQQNENQASSVTQDLDSSTQPAIEVPDLKKDEPSPESVSKKPGAISLRVPSVVGLVVVGVLAAAVVLYLARARLRPPARFRVEQNSLIVQDERGNELWRKDFEETLNAERYSDQAVLQIPTAWFGDLDGDGHVEMLFVRQTRQEHTESSALICFSDTGKEKWRFVPGRTLRTANTEFEPVFNIHNFAVASFGTGRPKSILVIDGHHLLYPVQVALLSPHGEMIREYWHSGQIGKRKCLQIADLNGDGVDEIYLAGINNAYSQATLVVLDPDHFEGASVEESPDFQLQGFLPGREIARVLFPRSCLNQKMERYNGVYELFVNNDAITLDVEETFSPPPLSAIYTLTRDFRLKGFVFSDGFIGIHTRMEASGQLNHHFSSKEEVAMRNIRVLRPKTTILTSSIGAEELNGRRPH